MIAASPKPKLTHHHIEDFKKNLGEKFVLIDEESLHHYSHDETEDLHFLPDVVLKPRSAEEISAILKICNRDRINATRGRYGLKWRRVAASRRCALVNRANEQYPTH